MENFIDNSQLLSTFIEFDNPLDFYVVQIIQRSKDGHSKTKLIKQAYVFSHVELNTLIESWIELSKDNNYRIYINPNRRNMEKMGIRCLQVLTKYLTDRTYNALPNIFNKAVGGANDELIKKWIIDIDSLDGALIAKVIDTVSHQHQYDKQEDRYRILATLRTPAGYHVITNPFNLNHGTRVLGTFIDSDIITIHKNSPTLIYSTIW